jgi:hypothetical protein
MINEITSNTNQHFRNRKKNELQFPRAKKNTTAFLKYIHFYSIYIKNKSINNYICVANRTNRKKQN